MGQFGQCPWYQYNSLSESFVNVTSTTKVGNGQLSQCPVHSMTDLVSPSHQQTALATSRQCSPTTVISHMSQRWGAVSFGIAPHIHLQPQHSYHADGQFQLCPSNTITKYTDYYWTALLTSNVSQKWIAKSLGNILCIPLKPQVLHTPNGMPWHCHNNVTTQYTDSHWPSSATSAESLYHNRHTSSQQGASCSLNGNMDKTFSQLLDNILVPSWNTT